MELYYSSTSGFLQRARAPLLGSLGSHLHRENQKWNRSDCEDNVVPGGWIAALEVVQCEAKGYAEA